MLEMLTGATVVGVGGMMPCGPLFLMRAWMAEIASSASLPIGLPWKLCSSSTPM